MNAFSHLGFEEWFSLGVLSLFILTPFISIAIEKMIERAKENINKKLAPHGLRLKQR